MERRRYRCEACIDAPPAFDVTLALADYRAPLDLLARGLKFRARLALGEEFARRLALAAQDHLDTHGTPEIVVPVPLSRERLIERGYNQAWQIARPLSGQHVGVVDDVMTSGATLDALAHTLKAAGAQRVTNFVALRTPKD